MINSSKFGIDIIPSLFFDITTIFDGVAILIEMNSSVIKVLLKTLIR
jgi:hypothetical protein